MRLLHLIFHMPRKKQIYTSEFPYHISARSHNKEWFDLPMSDVWKTMANYLYFIHHAYKVEIYAFVLMNNHFHLIAQFPENNMSVAMNYFMRETSRVISRDAGRINQTYGGRYFKSAIMKPLYLEHVYKYVYRNPVSAGIVAKAEEYTFSTLQILLGKRSDVIPLTQSHLLEDTLKSSTLEWINAKPDLTDYEEVRKALRRPEFSLRKRSQGKFVHHLEVDSY